MPTLANHTEAHSIAELRALLADATDDTRLHYALIDHPQPRARAAAAASPICPPDVLSRLARDTDRDVVAAVAAHASLPADAAITIIGTTADKAILRILASNLACDPTVLAWLAQEPAAATRCAVASNPNAPATLLSRLARDSSPRVRAAVIANPSTPDGIKALALLV